MLWRGHLLWSTEFTTFTHMVSNECSNGNASEQQHRSSKLMRKLWPRTHFTFQITKWSRNDPKEVLMHFVLECFVSVCQCSSVHEYFYEPLSSGNTVTEHAIVWRRLIWDKSDWFFTISYGKRLQIDYKSFVYVFQTKHRFVWGRWNRLVTELMEVRRKRKLLASFHSRKGLINNFCSIDEHWQGFDTTFT